MSQAPAVSKEGLRRRIRKAARQIPLPALERLSVLVCQHLEALPAIQEATGVAFYHGLPREVCLESLGQRLSASGKRLYLPRVEGPGSDGVRQMTFRAWYPGGPLESAGLGTQQPLADAAIGTARDIDVVLTPGRAFDLKGGRLGRGAAYYDRALATLGDQITRVGVCFDFQLLEAIPVEPWDIPMGIIITELGVRYRSRFQGP